MLRETKNIEFNNQKISIKTLGFYQFSKLVKLYILVGQLVGIEQNELTRGHYFNKVIQELKSISQEDLTGAFSEDTVVDLLQEIFTQCLEDIDFKDLKVESVFDLLQVISKESQIG